MGKALKTFSEVYDDPEKAVAEQKATQVAITRVLSGFDGLIGKVRAIMLNAFDDKLGFTQPGEKGVINIFVAFFHQIMGGLTHAEIIGMRMGIAAHEILHQLFTPFKEWQEMVDKEHQALRGQFHDLCNVIEDPRIEWKAPSVMGGPLLKALRFVRDFVYNNQPDIDEFKDQWQQYTKAVGDFANKGELKGKITDPKAREIFAKTAPLVAKAVREPSGKKALALYQEIWDIAKVLLPSQEEIERMQKALEQFMRQKGVESQTESGQGQKDNLEKKANELSKEMSKEAQKAQEKSEKGSGSSKSEDESSGKSEDESNDESEGKSNDESEDKTNGESESKSEDKSEGESESKSEGESEDESKSEGESADKSSGKSEDESNGKSDGESNDKSEDKSNDESSGGKGAGGGEGFSDKDAEYFNLEQIAREIEGDAIQANEPLQPIDDINIKISHTLRNQDVRAEALDKENYSKTVSSLGWAKKSLTKDLEEILTPDEGEKVKKSSGRYNVSRGSQGTTASVFDRRKDPSELKDAAVVILIDQSGSMGCCDGRAKITRLDAARQTAALLMESLERVNVPHYVMSYGGGVLYHYRRWDGRNKESLEQMTPRGGTPTGNALEYSSLILDKRNESEKLVVVISDGVPDCTTTVQVAVKNAQKRNQVVLGVGVGSCSPEILQNLFGSTFIWQPNPDLLASTVAKRFRKVFERLMK